MPLSFVRYHLPALAWATFVGVVLLEQPPSVTGVASGPIWLMFSLSSVWRDIAAHVAVFGLMGWLAVRSLRQLGLARAALTGILLTALYGALLEVAQHFTPGRALELRDLVANALGAWVGGWIASRLGSREVRAAIGTVWRSRRRERRAPPSL